MNNPKCFSCGLVNFSAETTCRRCATALNAECATDELYVAPDLERTGGRRSILKRVIAVCGLAGFILFICYLSLIASSKSLTYDQKRIVYKAIDVLERQGLDQDVFVLRYLVSFRASDNWWNKYIGHADAYASTNFPFEVVTLYPDFFDKSSDDVERAAILLHEGRHLAGKGEEDAFTAGWRDKSKLGWTKEKYGQTRVWRGVAELTRKYAPKLFQCGYEGNADCTE